MHNNQNQSDDSNSIKGIKNIDELRKSYELPHHWRLRKEFIQIYSDKYDLDRLICLSNVFVNVECMGLTYPDEVMKLNKELGSKVRGLEQYRYQFERDQEPELLRRQPYNSQQNNQNYNNRNYNQNRNQNYRNLNQPWRRQQQQ